MQNIDGLLNTLKCLHEISAGMVTFVYSGVKKWCVVVL